MKAQQKDLRLLPHYYKKIAISLILIAILIILLFQVEILTIEKHFVKLMAENILLIALLILALTKDKIEDELTLKLRMQSFAGSFIYGVLTVIVFPYTGFLFKDNSFSEKGSYELILSMLLFYFIIFFIAKRKR